jgi:hypothetical protein
MCLQEKEKKYWGTRVEQIDRRIIFLLLFLIVAIALVHPIGLPIPINPETKELYDTVEAVPDDSVIILGIDFGVGSWGEIGAAAIAVTQHVFNKQVKIIVISFGPEGPLVYQKIMTFIDTHGKVYGKDYVNLGYFPGGGTAIVAVGKNFRLAKVDVYGNDLDTLPVLNNINSIPDVVKLGGLDVVFESSTIFDIVPNWYAPYGLKIAVFTDALSYPMRLPYKTAGQIAAMSYGNLGGGGYEKLINKPGLASRNVDAATLIGIMVTSLVVLGNVGYIHRTYIKKIKGGV